MVRGAIHEGDVSQGCESSAHDLVCDAHHARQPAQLGARLLHGRPHVQMHDPTRPCHVQVSCWHAGTLIVHVQHVVTRLGWLAALVSRNSVPCSQGL